MSDPTVWWILAGSMVAIELLTGTFYLLMISIGLVAAALAAHAGANMTSQIVIAALVGGGAVAFWHWQRVTTPAAPRASANKDVNLDIGETVHVESWLHGHETAVQYRGAEWAASLAHGNHPAPGPHRIVEVLGNRLILRPVKPEN